MKISTEFNKKINLPMRSLLGCGDGDAIAFGSVGSAIAKRSVGIAFGMWEYDSEALRRKRFWDVGVR